MCGICGVVSNQPVNQLIYDSLLLLQHRGQDAAGIVTGLGQKIFMHKAKGMVRDVFRTRNMRALPGNYGIGHVRYPTAGNAHSEEESQPFYVNAPFGIVLAHNGNLTNVDELKRQLFNLDHRHINTESDTEVLLNVLAHELEVATRGLTLKPSEIFSAVRGTMKRLRGAYAVVALIAGYGLLAFRDPNGIRPLCYGVNDQGEVIVASESVAVEGTGHQLVRDIAPGEAVFVELDGTMHTEQCTMSSKLHPCIFEYVYLARPDSVIDGISVYQARVNMGDTLAQRVISTVAPTEIDVVIPVPESSRPSAMQVAYRIGKPYRDGFVKNRYVGRTFIMPGQGERRRSVRQKLNAMKQEFMGRNVLLVDDSIVRGTTSREIVQMAREAGASKVYLASAAPPVRYPNVYGIDMPTRGELVASGRTVLEIQDYIGCDALIYQDVDAMKRVIGELNPKVKGFEASCFDGQYITGDINEATFAQLEKARQGKNEDEIEEGSRSRLSLQGTQD
ncbi:Amidophosphoribosyltransferase [Saezia sanguinis]|uniref:Amidophosphoribosyltransferase n=1 Tax=Saezia sanguinis TaxID=1965230 RepID=A0A433SG55_9BURK|nr:amidophosphoribosyltransferase [Saezia sanguinis]RUS67723.1 Amidophosphoribosyltransferase [Saezia sanguinis]